MSDDELKKKIRESIWEKMERLGIARFPKPIYGRIPNFIGADKAAENLRTLREWEQAEVIFVNPDSPQLPVRAFGLIDQKKVVMATPRLRKGFVLLDPARLPTKNYWKVVTIRNAIKYGMLVHPSVLSIDIKITGSVAVDRDGGRLGKGHGYSDLEFAILREYGAVDDATLVITTVHDIQIVPHVPMNENDLPVDIIVTPKHIFRTNTRYRKPKGIILDLINKREVEKIPLLKELLSKKVN